MEFIIDTLCLILIEYFLIILPQPSFGVIQYPKHLNSSTYLTFISASVISNFGGPIARADQTASVLLKFTGRTDNNLCQESLRTN